MCQLWHALNFGELFHTAHHDFAGIPASRYPALRQCAPEFYQDLHECDSIMASIRGWLFASSDKQWMCQNGDFARRDAFLDDHERMKVLHPEDSKAVPRAYATVFWARLLSPKGFLGDPSVVECLYKLPPFLKAQFLAPSGSFSNVHQA
jgi:hypothetical protein